ncbi:MAG: glycosyltransferase [Parachlamydiaceae bacterium]
MDNTEPLIKTSTCSIGCVILTRQAKHHLPRCLQFLVQSPLKPRILVVDSSSTDGTVDVAQRLGAETLIIPQNDFNHGTTRELARKHLGTDIVCMFTQDAYLADKKALAHLVAPIIENRASITYARQIPHEGADFFEAFARSYNYPSTSHIRGIDDVQNYGVYTFFCSDSCAAYSSRALEEIGGFDEVLLGEDTVATAKLLRQGHKIAYVAEATVKHSHRYSLMEEFRRHFDTGLARVGYADLLHCGQGDSQRGLGYAKLMLGELAKKSPHLLPYACAHLLSKWTGYQIGRRSMRAPTWVKQALSSQKFYWKNRR